MYPYGSQFSAYRDMFGKAMEWKRGEADGSACQTNSVRPWPEYTQHMVAFTLYAKYTKDQNGQNNKIC